ncbi:MAG: UDP-N-acetylglucosamine 1-carboxyvinyltransferase [bacterium]
MQKLIINGPTKLEGVIKTAGSKNHVLPMLSAMLLTSEDVTIHNLPAIADAEVMIEILELFGVRVERTGSSIVCNGKDAQPKVIPAALTQRLRASLLILGPALARFGEVEIGMPGGDIIGARPIDTHINGLKCLGAKLDTTTDSIKLSGKLTGNRVVLDEISVTATENLILAAVLTPGVSEIRMAATEPHIVALCEFLNNLGAKISGISSHVLLVEGVESLHGGEGAIIPDYLESGTLAIAAASSGGNLVIEDFIISDHDGLLNVFSRMGVNYKILNERKLQVLPSNKLRATKIRTDIYPGFPSDLQAPMAVLFTQAEGVSEIFETMYEGRLQYLFELQRMGAHVNLRDSHIGMVEGPTTLHGTDLVSFDVRAGATILIAAVIAHGTTTIDRIEHIDRGYEHFDGRLRALGANISRTST